MSPFCFHCLLFFFFVSAQVKPPRFRRPHHIEVLPIIISASYYRIRPVLSSEKPQSDAPKPFLSLWGRGGKCLTGNHLQRFGLPENSYKRSLPAQTPPGSHGNSGRNTARFQPRGQSLLFEQIDVFKTKSPRLGQSQAGRYIITTFLSIRSKV